MVYPKVRFIQGHRLEAEYICFLAKSISLGLYQKAGFTILPFAHPKTVYFPDLKLSSKFWQTINNCHNQNYGHPFPKSCVAEVASLLPQVNYPVDSSKSKIVTQFFDLFSQFLDHDQLLSQVSQIDILVTAYGTGGSFYSLKSGKKVTISATYRIDLPINILAKTLLMALFKIQVRQHGETSTSLWSNRQAVIEYLFSHSIFASLFPNSRPVPITPQIITQGQQYLESLGFAVDQKINLNDTSFTPQEKKLLAIFSQNPTKIISFDEVATILWRENSDSKYSLSAMAKVISHLRHKIREQGIVKNVITTVRGQGYVFN